ncbi:MAG: F0F1 ATP synthase subunit delta [Micrococcales bacterium]|nr:F0F1 ATP synthase subunit delta [Micrococcales bacterium]
MLGGSLAALNQCTDRLDQVVGDDAATAEQVSQTLFALVYALDKSPALVRALANPNRDAASREQVLRQSLESFPAKAVELAAFVVSQRWSHDADLADALEQLGYDAVLLGAQLKGLLKQVESELFELDVMLVSNRDLRTALGDIVAPSQARLVLVDQVFDGQVLPETLLLVRRASTHPRGKGIRTSLGHLGDLVAARRNRLVAVVTTAKALSQAQIDKLSALLENEYGQAIQINVAVDPDMVGGLRIRVGDDVVDGTVVARFVDLKRAIAA